jgi:two-component system, OmpR family, sensor histidine kinase KdpD
MPRGRHKVFLGMAAGVGKTFRMLQEGQAEAEAGRDVVIGYLEPHDRPATSAQAVGLELVPRRRVEHGGLTLHDLDVDALLARAPELCLIDELAHTNAVGSERAKRYEDVEVVLAAGIDVFSTVNVQHLESLNDQIADLVRTRVRETLPDAVLRDADEVVLVDLTPEALIARLRRGEVYPTERVEAALRGFFKIEQLASLREVALRQAAEVVEARRREPGVAEAPTPASRRDDRVASSGPQAVGERCLALVEPRPDAQRVVRRAWRSARRLGGELDLLWVTVPGRPPSEGERESLEALRRLASVLGAQLLVEAGDDLVAVTRRVVAERGTTYVLLGTPSVRRGLARLRPGVLDRLVQALPGVDIRVVADRAAREADR